MVRLSPFLRTFPSTTQQRIQPQIYLKLLTLMMLLSVWRCNVVIVEQQPCCRLSMTEQGPSSSFRIFWPQYACFASSFTVCSCVSSADYLHFSAHIRCGTIFGNPHSGTLCRTHHIPRLRSAYSSPELAGVVSTCATYCLNSALFQVTINVHPSGRSLMIC